MQTSGAGKGQSASELISNRTAELRHWRGPTISRTRKLIAEADPDFVEEMEADGHAHFFARRHHLHG